MKTNALSPEFMNPYEVEIHYKRPLFSSMQKIASSLEASTILRNYIDTNVLDVKEFFWIILLSRANKILGISAISSGTISGVLVNYREIIQLTLLSNASHIIVAHNHPSGKLAPSENDRRITEKLQEGLNLFDAKLLDHLILTSESYYSFADAGNL
ncbi:JAB domain-containing protein [Polaribacter vadi]|uniref:JAB domain-containing protein n=1 Tax=Polaribacter vadi TaxID=1774273 RepID=UPI0030EF4766|tara:strand:+ start:31102 stop:31569 length:468 start_codon:yes stop_codon:yes gene_type:complete